MSSTMKYYILPLLLLLLLSASCASMQQQQEGVEIWTGEFRGDVPGDFKVVFKRSDNINMASGIKGKLHCNIAGDPFEGRPGTLFATLNLKTDLKKVDFTFDGDFRGIRNVSVTGHGEGVISGVSASGTWKAASPYGTFRGTWTAQQKASAM